MTAPPIDWSRYRACAHCFAGAGQPCLKLSGQFGADPVAVVADSPHGNRPLRTAKRGDS